jgi:dTDP-4-dehydrorhamnose reductase
VLQWARQKEALRLVTDQVGNPTWCRALAEITAMLAARGEDYLRERKGLYHLAGSGYASRFEWARTLLELDPQRKEQTVKELLPALTADFPTPAQRPLFSALECEKFNAAFGLNLPPWKEALQLAME